MSKIKLTLEYNGANFSGWQRQREKIRSVQGELESALQIFIASERKKNNLPEKDDYPITQGSGRTDAGVHARAQVVSFIWPEDVPSDVGRLRKALGGILPSDISVRGCELVGDEFDARFTPHNKQYSYRIALRDSTSALEENRVLIVRDQLDVAAMVRAAKLLEGTKDFATFRAVDCIAKTTERTIYLSEFVRINDEELKYIVQGNGFLKQMIRIIVGTLLDVGRGKTSLSDLSNIIEAKERRRAGETAPAWGLYLDWVRYGE